MEINTKDEVNSPVLYEVDGGIAFITLNRPERMNAVNDVMDDQIQMALDQFDQDDSAGVAIISGSGDHFSAGADIRERFQEGEPSESERRKRFHRIDKARTSEGWLGRTANWKPVLAAVQGYCLGVGFGLVLECDLIVATEGASFGITETKRGLPGGRIWARLNTFMPSKIATEVLLTGRRVSAVELHRLGLINRLVPQGRHLPEAEELARELLQLPPLAVRSGVRVSRRTWLPNVMDADYYVQALHLQRTNDFREATSSFVEKRPPHFEGH